MLQVPLSWGCSKHPAAVVVIRFPACSSLQPPSSTGPKGEALRYSLCRVVPLARAARARYEIELMLSLDGQDSGSGEMPSLVRRLVSQDCSPPETHWAHISHISGQRFAFSPLADDEMNASLSNDIQCIAELTIFSPSSVRVAKSVTLCGPRKHARITPSHLSSCLLGCYVVVGAHFTVVTEKEKADTYEVAQVELKGTGGSSNTRVIALFGAMCKVRLNDVAPRHSNAPLSISLASPFGLEAHVSRLRQQLSRIATWPEPLCRGLLVRGPHGCGVSTVLRHCLGAHFLTSLSAEVMAWRTGVCSHHNTALEACIARARMLILVVTDFSVLFPDAEPQLAKMNLQVLQREVRGLFSSAAHHKELRVTVVSFTHQYGSCASGVVESFFTEQIVIVPPDTEQRAALLAHCCFDDASRSGEMLDASLELVGHTRAETIETGMRLKEGISSNCRRPALAKKVTWDDVGGLTDAKRELQQAIVSPQRYREVFKKFNLTAPNGVLLFGPPGCAKTTLVKALCSEGISSLLYLDSASVMSAYVGESERMLRDTFHRAAQQAPCIVFFDEVEVLGGARGSGANSDAQARLLSTVLTEMDGFTTNAAKKGVCFVGATNCPHLMDSALLRPGRFDRLIYIPLPGERDRENILSLYLRETAANTERLAELTYGFSGADLKGLCTQSLLHIVTKVCDEALLHDGEFMDTFLAHQVEVFPRAPYDLAGIQAFHQRVGGGTL